MKYREQILAMSPEAAPIWLLTGEIKTARGETITFPVDVEEVYFVDLEPTANWGHPSQFVGFTRDGQVFTVKSNTSPSGMTEVEYLFREPPELKWLPALRSNYPKLLSLGRELRFLPFEGEIELCYGPKKLICPEDGEVYQLDLADGPIDDEIHYSKPHPCLFFIFDAEGKCSIQETTHPIWPSYLQYCKTLPLQENKET